MRGIRTVLFAASSTLLLSMANVLLSKGHSFLFFGETEIPEELK